MLEKFCKSLSGLVPYSACHIILRLSPRTLQRFRSQSLTKNQLQMYYSSGVETRTTLQLEVNAELLDMHNNEAINYLQVSNLCTGTVSLGETSRSVSLPILRIKKYQQAKVHMLTILEKSHQTFYGTGFCKNKGEVPATCKQLGYGLHFRNCCSNLSAKCL